ncbi:hypothetical protein AFA91_04585 [Mycolicibacterium goodii]|uniref:Pyrrolo-quinoline quinone n=2 Tax=Mycolicibacterium goodii TaxID=134601 RepID=A0A0K0XFA1_MYCGD|nr:hypothetical protein AFA91_04585 [Mycolicibacterium goodii]
MRPNNDIRSPHSRSRRRTWIVLATALVVIVALAAGGIWWNSSGSEMWARAQWQPPPTAYLSSPMDQTPVPGWRTSVSDLGVPPAVPGGETARIAVSNKQNGTHAFIDTLDNRGFFLARSSEPGGTSWWLTGLDATDGHTLFPAVQLNTGDKAPECFLNGPDAMVCLVDDGSAATAWVVDLRTGGVTYTGPTPLRLSSTGLRARRTGDYLLAVADKEGIYGVGPQAEPTWFIPGLGTVFGPSRDIAAQGTNDSQNYVFFSLTDGREFTPEIPDGTFIDGVRFDDDGFAALVVADDEFNTSTMESFDLTGKKIGTLGRDGYPVAAGLYIDASASDWRVVTAEGSRLLSVEGHIPYDTLLIGSTLYINESNNAQMPYWQPYDLNSGDKGKACEIDLGRKYLGTDGTTAVTAVTNPQVDLIAKAFDLKTCEMVWSLPKEANSLGRIWRIGDTLVQLSDDGTELNSLTAPN